MVSGYESQETRAIVLGGRVVVRATIANQDVIQLHGALLKGFFVEKLAIFLPNYFYKNIPNYGRSNCFLLVLR